MLAINMKASSNVNVRGSKIIELGEGGGRSLPATLKIYCFDVFVTSYIGYKSSSICHSFILFSLFLFSPSSMFTPNCSLSLLCNIIFFYWVINVSLFFFSKFLFFPFFSSFLLLRYFPQLFFPLSALLFNIVICAFFLFFSSLFLSSVLLSNSVPSLFPIYAPNCSLLSTLTFVSWYIYSFFLLPFLYDD